MQKVSFILSILTVLFLILLSCKVQAADGTNEFFLANSIEIHSTTSTYKTGTTLTITLKNTDGAVEITDPPELVIQFGSGQEIQIKCDTEPGKVQELKYTYTIKDSDVGKLKILKEQQTVSNGVVNSSLGNITLNKDIIANSDKVTDDDGDDSTATWTNFEKAIFEWSDYTETDHSTPSLIVKNVDLSKSNHYYYYYISNNKNDNPDLNKLGEDLKYWQTISSEGKIGASALTNYLETNGDIYIWIAEVQNGEKKIVLTARKIERLEQLPLTKRIVGYFSDELSGGIFCYEPHSTSRKINIKIGRVTDDTILRNIRDNKDNAMSDLLSYAKSTGSIFEKTYTLGENPTMPENINIKDKAYYFIYFELEDENGKYYPVEDVELYQASVSDRYVTLINHTDRNFVYNISEDTGPTNDGKDYPNNTVDNTTTPEKIPQTGLGITVIPIIVVLAIIAGTISYKVTKYRNIN